MKKWFIGALASAAILTVPAYAVEETQEDGKVFEQTVGDWTVQGFRDREINFCSATRINKDGAYLSNITMDSGERNVMVFSPSWNISDPVGHFDSYVATVRFFGSVAPEQGTIDFELIDTQTIILQNVNENFFVDFFNPKLEVINVVLPGDIPAVNFPITGVTETISVMDKCLSVIGTKKPKTST